MSKRPDEIMDNYLDESGELLDWNNEIWEYVGYARQSIFEDLDIWDSEGEKKNCLGVAQLYSKDLWKYPIISKDELNSLISKYKLLDDRDPEKMKVRDKIINSSLRYSYKISKAIYLWVKDQYKNNSLELKDLVQVWSIWLIEALDRYNSDAWNKFLYYASYVIKSKIYSYLKYDSSFFWSWDHEGRPTWSSVQWRKMLGDFYQKNMREPTDEEMESMILDHNMESSTKFSRYYWKYYKYCLEPGIQSLDEHFSAFENKIGDKLQNQYPDVFSYDEDDLQDEYLDENLEITLKDILNNPDYINSPEDQLFLEDLKKLIDELLETLPNKEAEIIRLFFWLTWEKPLELQEIWEKVGLTGGRVRQIKEKWIRRLRELSKQWIMEKLRLYIEH